MPVRMTFEMKVSEMISSFKDDLLEISDLLTGGKMADLIILEQRCRNYVEVLAANVAEEFDFFRTRPQAFRIPIHEMSIYISALVKLEMLTEEILESKFMYEWPEKIRHAIEELDLHSKALEDIKEQPGSAPE